MGIQISGLLAGSAFDWKSIVDQLVAIDSIPITKLQTEKSTNNDKVSALNDVNTSLQALQDSLQSIRANNVFSSRAVSSDLTNTTWKSTSSAGASVGTYKFAVSQLATSASINGKADIGVGIAPTANVTGVTLANMNTAIAVTAGVFTVAGKQVTIATTDSLQNVFDKISAATGATVTGSYDPVADKVTLTKTAGELVLGAANDTSNFLQVMRLANNTTSSSASTGALGTLKPSATLATAGLRAAITAVDAGGNGSFMVNNVAIAYNVNTDTLTSVIGRINASTANVTASYDATNDRMVLTNKSTGDVGVSVSEAAGGLMDALGLSTTAGATLTHGTNAVFTINGGAPITSASNTLDASVTGITGLSVTVNTATTQTITVDSDVSTMQTAINDFITKFNAVQDTIDAKTKVSVNGSNVTTSILSDNREIQTWARQLQQMAFNPMTGVTGSVTHLDDLGIDFDGTTGHLMIKNQAKLSSVLATKPADVAGYFVSGSNGLVPTMYGTLTTLMASDRTQQGNLTQANSGLDKQITTLQARIAQEREMLTTSFMHMLDAQSAAQSQNQSITNSFFKSSGN